MLQVLRSKICKVRVVASHCSVSGGFGGSKAKDWDQVKMNSSGSLLSLLDRHSCIRAPWLPPKRGWLSDHKSVKL